MTPSQQALAPRLSTTLDTVQDILGTLVSRYRTDEVLTSVQQIPAREAEFRPMPDWVRTELAEAYRAKGIKELYSHQAATAELVHGGKNVVVLTPTASGKTLCYNLPVLNAVLENPDTRALFCFQPKHWPRTSWPNYTISPSVSMTGLVSSPTMATRRRTRARRYGSADISSCRTRTCCTPESCLTTPSGCGCSRTCAISCWMNCTPIAGFSGAISRMCYGDCDASRSSTVRIRSSFAVPLRLQTPASWPRN